jgi:hypothetical protein
LDGEIVALENGRVRIRLESGIIGILEDIVNANDESLIQLGQHGKFQILRCDDNGETILCLVSRQDPEVSPSFEHDVDELQNALTHHHAPSATHEDTFTALDEQRIQQWLNRVEKNLSDLRRNRAKRLDEEFYSGS